MAHTLICKHKSLISYFLDIFFFLFTELPNYVQLVLTSVQQSKQSNFYHFSCSNNFQYSLDIFFQKEINNKPLFINNRLGDLIKICIEFKSTFYINSIYRHTFAAHLCSLGGNNLEMEIN